MGQSRKGGIYLYLIQTPNSAPKTASKRVFLVTDEDNPHPGKGSKQLITSARTTLIVRKFAFPIKKYELERLVVGLDTSGCYCGAILHQH